MLSLSCEGPHLNTNVREPSMKIKKRGDSDDYKKREKWGVTLWEMNKILCRPIIPGKL